MQIPWGLWNLWRGFPKELQGRALSSIFNSTETEPFLVFIWTQSMFHVDGNRFQNSYNLSWFPPSCIWDWIHWTVILGLPIKQPAWCAGRTREQSRGLPTAPEWPWREPEAMEKPPWLWRQLRGPEHSTGETSGLDKEGHRKQFLHLLPARHRLH